MVGTGNNVDEVDQLASEDEYEVEAIVDHRKTGSQMEYLVKWKDYDDESNTWEPSENLAEAQQLVSHYFDLLKKRRKAKKTSKTTKHQKRTISTDSDDETSKLGTPKKIKIAQPVNGMSPASKKEKHATADDDESVFVDAQTTGFGSDNENGTPELKQSTLDATSNDELETMEYKLENEDGVSQVVKVIVDEKYPSEDVDWEDKVESVVVLLGKNDGDKGNEYAILKWNDGKHSLHSIKDVRKSCPQRLIDYYQGYLLF